MAGCMFYSQSHFYISLFRFWLINTVTKSMVT